MAADSRLRYLDRYVPPLSLMRAFGVARDEVAHSRMLADLLDPRRHRGAREVLATLLREVASGPGLDPEVALDFRRVAEGPWERVSVHRERLLIDVVVEVSQAERAVVIGIENKVDAREQAEQLARHQAALARAYPGRTAAVVFLTPTGRGPSTADRGTRVPVVALGYSAVLAAIGEARAGSPPGSGDERALSLLVSHLKEEILGEGDRERTLARELWRDHNRALRLAMEHRPNVGDVKDELVGLLRDRYGQEANVFVWPERGAPKEIKMDLWRWFERGFPFTFLFHEDPEGRPSVRVLSWRGNYLSHAETLARWAPAVNARLGRVLVDERLSRIRGWDWHKVLAEEDYPPEAALAEDAYDARTARAAFEAIVGLVETLRPHVEGPAVDGTDMP